MKKGWLVFGLIVLAGAAGGGGYWYYTQNVVQSDENAVYVSALSSLTAANSGYMNRYAGVVEAQQTLEIKIESGRKVKEVKVKTGDVVKKGQLLFEYDLTSIQQSLKEAKLDLDKLKNEAASLTNQIATLEKEQKKAKQENQLSYTIEIETTKMNLKKNEYDQISKQSEIERLQNATGNTEVRSEIEGIIQKIDATQMNSGDGDSVSDTLDDSGSYEYGDSSDSNAFITILSTGEYRVKGSINELNIYSIAEGDSVIVRSRADESETWTGMLSMIDRDNATSSNRNNWGYYDSGDSDTNSSSYPFYIELESSDGLMLGQHVYIEPDNGQNEIKTGIWLSEAYIADADTETPYVWAADSKNRLEKRTVTLGQYDEMLGEYEITEGLTKEDYLAFPAEYLEEGLPTTTDITEAADWDEDFGDSWEDSDESEDTWGEYDVEDPWDEDDMEDYSMDDMEGYSTEDIGDMDDLDSFEEFSEEDMMEEPAYMDDDFGELPELDFETGELIIDEDMEEIE